jgi:hypothetical protein
VVFRRGPSDWWLILHWDLERLILTPGAWFRGTLYPRRCDISPDGRLFGYFALKSGKPYFAVSRPPWLQALAMWETLGTWTWGCSFSASGDLEIAACIYEPFQPDHYPAGKVAIRGIRTDWPKRDVWNELKRGWKIVEGEPEMTLRRANPDGITLGLIHHGVNFRRPGMEGVQLEYFLQHRPDDVTPLPEAAWADWDREGRLLMATREGSLQVFRCRGAERQCLWSEDLRGLEPDPQPAPAWAGKW